MVAVGQPVKGIIGGVHMGDHGGVVEEVLVLQPEDTFERDRAEDDEGGDMVRTFGTC